MNAKRNLTPHGFTIMELMVVIGVIAVLLGILLPTLSTIRESSGETKCASNLRELSTATIAYLSNWDNCLPQKAADDPFAPPNPDGSQPQQVVGALFAGKRGELPFYGIDQVGIRDRPLNRYLTGGRAVTADNISGESIDEHLPVCECPLDRGQKPEAGGFVPQANHLHELLGCSYTLNDHTLDGEAECTLVPRQSGGKPGGRMPLVDDPSKTWLLGDHPIYNYQEGGDRRQLWHFKQVRVNLAFVDGHVGMGIEVPKGIENTTKWYTFLPQHDWKCD